MKYLTCVSVIALALAAGSFAQAADMGQPPNSSTSPDQSVQTSPNNGVPAQHSLAPSSPGSMGGPNAAATQPQRNGSDQDRAMRGKSTRQSSDQHRASHPQMASRSGRAAADQAENPITRDLNRQQLANNGRVPAQTATRPGDCAPGQIGCTAPNGPAPSQTAPMR